MLGGARARPAACCSRRATQRVRPARDEKVLAAWNGMMLRALAEAGRVLERADYTGSGRDQQRGLPAARDARADGALLRTWKPGHAARLNGYLEDYANVADGLARALRGDLRPALAHRRAIELADVILERFADPERGGFFDTVDRPRDADHPPEGPLRQRHAVGQRGGRRRPAAAGAAHRRRRLPRGRRGHPAAARARRWCAIRSALRARSPRWTSLLGHARERWRSLAPRRSRYSRPAARRLRALPAEQGRRRRRARQIPLLRRPRRRAMARPTAYVCEHYVCQAPTSDPAQLSAQCAPRVPSASAFGQLGQRGPARGQRFDLLLQLGVSHAQAPQVAVVALGSLSACLHVPQSRLGLRDLSLRLAQVGRQPRRAAGSVSAAAHAAARCRRRSGASRPRRTATGPLAAALARR